jgi:hypothetical protein
VKSGRWATPTTWASGDFSPPPRSRWCGSPPRSRTAASCCSRASSARYRC